MSTIKRGIIKSYTAATHKASVQIAGSLSVWLDGVPVATDIPATEVVAGRDCGVLFFTEDNPDDAVVVTVHGAVPSPVLAGSYIADNDGNTSVSTETMPNEDRIRMLIAGVLRYMMAEASPHHDLTGDLRLSGVLAVKGATPDVTQSAYIIARDATAPDGQIAILADVGGLTSVGTGAVVGIGGRALARNTATVTAYGLDYVAGANAQSLVDAAAVRAQITVVAAIGKTITNATCILVRAPLNLGGTITNAYGVRVEAITTGGNRRPIQEEGSSGPGDAHGNRFRSNTQFGSLSGSFGGGDGVIGLADASVAPLLNPSGGGVLYAQGGALKWRGSSGTVTTIAPA